MESASIPGARTAADVRLEVAAMSTKPRSIVAGELELAVVRLQNARSQVALRALELSRMVDRAAGAHGEAWTLETLQMTEDDLIALCTAQTPSLLALKGRP